MQAPLLEIMDLRVVARQRELLAGIHCSVSAGEVVAVFGPFGSGKSALLQAASGQIPPDSGMIRLFGAPVKKRDSRVELAAGPVSGSTAHHVASKSAGGGSPGQKTASVTRALETMELFEIRDLPLKDVGEGRRRAAALAAALASDSSLLLIDDLLDTLPEPLFERAWGHLRARAEKTDSAVLVSTVRSSIALRADMVLVLHNGAQLAYDKPESLLGSCMADTVTIEAVSAALVQGTLRGLFDIEIEETADGARFSSADGASAAAGAFRHPPEGARAVYVRRPTLWDVYNRLRDERERAEKRIDHS